MNMLHTPTNQRGFTLVEVLIAMALFSFMLLIMLASVFSQLHIYQSEIQIRQTQKTARLTSLSFAEDLRNSIDQRSEHATTPSNFDSDRICLLNGPGGRSGIMYYTKESATNNLQLMRRTFVNMPTTMCTLDTTVSDGPVFTGEQRISDDSVSVLEFTAISKTTMPAIVSDPAYIGANLTIVSDEALADLVDLTPSAVLCKDNDPGRPYCSVTHLTVGGTTHQEVFE